MLQFNQKLRFILVNLVPPILNEKAALYDLEELKSLVSTFGGATIVRVIQRRNHPDPSTFIGKGKALEVMDMINRDKINIVVLNSVVNTSQLFNLEKIFWSVNPNIKVWDRIDLILNIFDKHAVTSEAKLQIELARMRHMGPRMYGLGGTVLSRQGGGIGGRGIGETNVELMKRHWRDQMKKITDQLKKISKNHEQRLLRRKESGIKTISIIGYTNAGKTTLFNLLTSKKKLAENVLFSTLDSSVGKLLVPNNHQEILVSDTIGFIQNLPTNLIEAFRSTLMESIYADLLVHVIDASDVRMHEKIGVVESILRDLQIDTKKKIYVFNKIDKTNVLLNKSEIQELYGNYNPQFISAFLGDGISSLKNQLINSLC